MPHYNYCCNNCLELAELIKGSALDDTELQSVMFETAHSMNPSQRELLAASECPRCLGTNTVKVLHGIKLTSYVRGYGYLDRAGARRDMNLYKLQNDDPYKAMRVTGETDDLVARLKRGGKHNPKPKHILMNDSVASMKEAVTKAVNSSGKE